MSLLVSTGSMKYRENALDSWHPLLLKANIVIDDVLYYDRAQTLTSAEQAQVRSNIGVGNVGTLSYTVVDTF